MAILKMTDVDLKGKQVFLREDLNVPMKDGEITSDIRIRAAIPTIQHLLKAGAKVMIASHLGRPTEGVPEAEFSLAPVAQRLSELLKKTVPLKTNWLNGVEVKAGEAVLCENVRFNSGETNNSDELAKQMAALCDVFVMDAFATAHRAEASTYGIAKFAPVACAGPLLLQEVEALDKALAKPKRPLLAIVGGSKVSTKLSILDSLSKLVDQLIVGGGIANTFIAAAGYDVGQSLCEPDLIDEAERLTSNAKARGAAIPLPTDVVVAERMSATAEAYIQPISQVGDTEKILDIGPETTKEFIKLIKKAGTIIWNGPVGAFEVEQFAEGTKQIAHAIAESQAFSLAGGGDTLAAIEKYNITDKISYISTGGGAFLAYLEGKKLPAIAILEERAGEK